MREVITQLARRLSSRAPHLLWLAIACRDASSEVGHRRLDARPIGPRGQRAGGRSNPRGGQRRRNAVRSRRRNGSGRRAHARALGRGARTRGGDASVLPDARAPGWRAGGQRRGPRDTRCSSRDRAALRIAPALPLLPRSQGMARRRPLVPGAPLRRLHGSARRLPAARARPAVLRNAEHAGPITRAHGAALGRIPFLNGGLFARSPLERAHSELEFRDEELGRFSPSCSAATASRRAKRARTGRRRPSIPRCSVAHSSR